MSDTRLIVERFDQFGLIESNRLYDQRFGDVLQVNIREPCDFYGPSDQASIYEELGRTPIVQSFHPVVTHRPRAEVSGTSELRFDSRHFTITLKDQPFQPAEMQVAIENNTIKVTGVHDSREDGHGVICRSFNRHFAVPANADLSQTIALYENDTYRIITPWRLPPLQTSPQDTRPIPLSIPEELNPGR